ncbi:MAG: RNA methyltransferase [Actinomycetales bacterium]|jgi:tRNA G18 (ribose-2'-O)-methylase SpoU|nr:RNA methyltransferase [Actinomycetales bacterium]
MPIHSINTADDPRLIAYRDLTDVALRRKSEPENGVYIAESAKIIERAVACGHTPVSILMADNWLAKMRILLPSICDNDFGSIDVFTGSHAVLEELTGFHVHRGALAEMIRPAPLSLDSVLERARRVVVLENIVDHTNVGAIFRAAAGLGIDAILVTPECADPLYRRSIRVSMGAVFTVPWARIPQWPTSIKELKEKGFYTVAISPQNIGGQESQDLRKFVAGPLDRVALILGTEGDGLTAASLETCDHSVHIPMSNAVSSLNVASAAAVVFWALQDSH